LRYYLAKTMGGTDAQISRTLVTSCYNTDLANNIGNLHSRVVKFVNKRCGNTVPSPTKIDPADAAVVQFAADHAQEALDKLDLATIPDLVHTALKIADRLNLHFNDMEPWKLIKDEARKERLDSVLYVTLDSMRILFELLSPVIPDKAKMGLESIGAEPFDIPETGHRFEPSQLPRDVPLIESPNLFPRIEG